MTSPGSSQTMKAATAAKKLGVHLPATPVEFQESTPSRAELAEMHANPPEWLATLLRDGPHPRPVIAGKLGISIAGLARGGVDEALTTAQIKELLQAPPQWLVQERATQAEVREEQIRVKNRDAGRAAMAAERERQDGAGGARR
ncbi:DUF5997 family protein [Clavibacter sp. VKM Ac-2872]|uniref:DUF5997 family protein n=1 Tax=Clavibacter sp. VKM Ac-2872 TaxID=2783812 RepID=UPI00188CE9D5|nr:DUF5997 family protein [Clavibacter sp. VKM Ac-2872]MBF4624964.1 hypothetical protein [Clavibacter sp. VKM Ac-2872]